MSVVCLIGMQMAAGQEWEKLFNGEDLSGWVQLDGNAEFRVEDGMVIGVSRLETPNSFLVTEKNYGDFILEYEMKMDRGLNSGVQFRSRATLPGGTARVNGYQVECDDHDDRPWAGGIFEEADRGWLYPMTYHPEVAEVNKRGEWNHVRVEAMGHTIRTYINGSSFANLVDDARPEGFIALQVHSITDPKLAGREIRWRNIRILTDDPGRHMKQTESLAPQVSYMNNVLTDEQKAMGWTLLWDGKSTRGWKGATSDRFPDHGWELRDGVMTVNPGGPGAGPRGGDIITGATYGNFILEVDFRITKGANSGIKYFVDPELIRRTGQVIGCEYQILDDDNHPDAVQGIAGNHTLASLYDLIKADAVMVGQDNRETRFNGVGSWNRARIEVKGARVAHYLNGVKVVEYERGNQMWRALVAGSKYAEYPGFGEIAKGHILLQDHEDEVSFRNIRILEL